MYEKKRAYLSMRSKILEPSPSFLPEANSAPPHKGHPSKKMGLSAGMINAPTSKSVSFEEFRLRFSFHDLEDLQEGHFFSNLTMFDFHARAYREDGSVPKLRLARATLFDIFSLRPVNHFEQPWSWKAEVSWRDLLEPDCFQCYAAHLGGAGGFSLDLDRSGSSLVVYALLSLSGDLLSRREKGKGGLEMRLVGGPQAGLWMHVLSPDDYLHLEASRLFERQTGARMRVVLKYGLALDRTWQLHLKYDQIARQREGSVGLSRYL